MNFSKFRISQEKYDSIKGDDWPLYENFITTRLSELNETIKEEIIKFNEESVVTPGLDHFLLNHTHNYFSINWENLRVKFKNSELIGQNYSHSWQDIFVLSMLNGKMNGTYLEIGANTPIEYNNTFLLEYFFNFNGISIDKLDLSLAWKIRPKANFLCEDAVMLDYHELLNTNFAQKQIDYCQIDIDSPTNHLTILKSLLSSGYRFSVFTYETCADLDSDPEIKESITQSRNLFLKNGYMLMASDVLHWSDNEWIRLEDWWIDPTAIDPTILDKFKNIIPLDNKNPFFLLIDTGE